MNDQVQKELSVLRAKLERNTRFLWVSWILFCCLFLFSAFQGAPQPTKLQALHIVDEQGNVVLKIEGSHGEGKIEMRTASMGTVITSGNIVLQARDQNNHIASSTLDFYQNAPRLSMNTLDQNGSFGVGFENSQPALVLKNSSGQQRTFLQSGALNLETTDGSKKVVASVAGELPVIEAVDKKGATERTGRLASVGVGARAGDAVTELRSDGSGAQVLNLTSADGKSSIQMNVANHTVTVKTQKDGNTIPWPQ